ncbi:MAG: hypothetical protein K2K95_01060 [Muribaculaceae bacterium]|nr:hypothetical protein [Muribaculaceae bacterium]
MNTKTILFRYKSAAGPFACTDGEIESSVNARLIPTSASYVADDDYPYVSADGSSLSSDSSLSSGTSLSSGSVTISDSLKRLNRLSTLLPLVEFSLSPMALAGWQNHPANPPSISVEAPKSKDLEEWTAKASETLDKFHSAAERQHLFTQPIFALSALRLKSGRHILPSSPVLLIPNTTPPIVEGSDNFSLDSMTMTIRNAVCHRLRLCVSLPSADKSESNPANSAASASLSNATTDSLSDYSDIIEAIDIFLSSPLPLYNHNEPLSAIHRASGSSSPMSWQPQAFTDNEFSARLLSAVKFRAVSSIPLSSIPDGVIDVDFNIPDFSAIPALAKEERLEEFISYTPDYLAHHGIEASTVCTFSGLTTLTDLSLTLPAPPALSALIPGCDSSISDTQPTSKTALELESIKNGEVIHSYAFDPAWPEIQINESNFPAWLFIPDADARQLSLISPEGIYIVPLRRHPLLNGAFYWCGSAAGRDISLTGVRKVAASISLPSEKTVRRDSWCQPGTIRISDFSLSYSNTELSRLSRAPVMIVPADTSFPLEIVTRPIKLASLLRFQESSDGIHNSMSKTLKKQWQLGLIGPFKGKPRLTLYGSCDLVTWQPIASTEAPLLHVAALHDYHYGRLKISGSISGALEAIALIKP